MFVDTFFSISFHFHWRLSRELFSLAEARPARQCLSLPAHDDDVDDVRDLCRVSGALKWICEKLLIRFWVAWICWLALHLHSPWIFFAAAHLSRRSYREAHKFLSTSLWISSNFKIVQYKSEQSYEGEPAELSRIFSCSFCNIHDDDGIAGSSAFLRYLHCLNIQREWTLLEGEATTTNLGLSSRLHSFVARAHSREKWIFQKRIKLK